MCDRNGLHGQEYYVILFLFIAQATGRQLAATGGVCTEAGSNEKKYVNVCLSGINTGLE